MVPGSPEARISLIHVSDLVDAIIACLHAASANRQTFTLCDGKDRGYSWQELAAISAQYWARGVRLWRIPRRLLDAVGLPVKGHATDPAVVIEALSRDKKRRDGRVSFVLAPEIGAFRIVPDVPPDAIRRVLEELV